MCGNKRTITIYNTVLAEMCQMLNAGVRVLISALSLLIEWKKWNFLLLY